MKRAYKGALTFVFCLAVPCCSSNDKLDGFLDHQRTVCLKGSVCGDWYNVDYCIEKAGSDDWLIFTPGSIPYERAVEQARCIRAAKNCDDYWRCVLDTDFEECDSSFEDHCEEDIETYCRELPDGRQVISRMDCSQYGNKCLSTEFGPMCGYDLCELGARCEGDLALGCTGNPPHFSFAYDCSQWNKKCVEGEYGPTCVDAEFTSCDVEMCSGAVIQICIGGYVSSWDCTDIDPDFVCFINEADDPRCGMPEGQWECNIQGNGWCEGSVAKTCVNGKVVSVDCGSFMNAQCIQNPDGRDRTSAHCEAQ
jgi:hypothetical protein